MRILNWNILSGGGTRVSGIIETVLSQAPDICVLTEFRHGTTGAALKAGLFNLGYPYCLEPESQKSQNSAAIFSKEPLAPTSLPIEIPGSLRPYLVATEIRGCCLIGVFCKDEQIGTQFIQFMSQLPEDLPEKSYLVTGDFFFGPRRSNSNYGKPLLGLEKAGWVNAWNLLRENQEFWSCRTNRGMSRPDHFYLHGPIRELIHGVEATERPGKHPFSDHEPMTIKIHLSRIHHPGMASTAGPRLVTAHQGHIPTPLDSIDDLQAAYCTRFGTGIPAGEFCTNETLELAIVQARLAIAGGRGPLSPEEFPSPLEDLPVIE